MSAKDTIDEQAAMRVRVWDGSPHEDGVVYLRLIQLSDQEVMLAAVGQDGECLSDPMSVDHGGGLLCIADGHICRSPAVMPALGFDLDTDDRVILDPWGEKITAQRAQRFGGKRAAFRVVSD